MPHYEVLEVMLVGVAFGGLTASNSVQKKKRQIFHWSGKKAKREACCLGAFLTLLEISLSRNCSRQSEVSYVLKALIEGDDEACLHRVKLAGMLKSTAESMEKNT